MALPGPGWATAVPDDDPAQATAPAARANARPATATERDHRGVAIGWVEHGRELMEVPFENSAVAGSGLFERGPPPGTGRCREQEFMALLIRCAGRRSGRAARRGWPRSTPCAANEQ